jgi:hypothetical protein
LCSPQTRSPQGPETKYWPSGSGNISKNITSQYFLIQLLTRNNESHTLGLSTMSLSCMGVVEIQLHTFITLELNCGEWSEPCPRYT